MLFCLLLLLFYMTGVTFVKVNYIFCLLLPNKKIVFIYSLCNQYVNSEALDFMEVVWA